VPEGKYAWEKLLSRNRFGHFLAKILRSCSQGPLRPARVPTGGFAMRVDPAEVRLLDHLSSVGWPGALPAVRQRSAECNDDMACSMPIAGWPSVRVSWITGENTIADLVKALELKKKSIAMANQAARPGAWLPQNGLIQATLRNPEEHGTIRPCPRWSSRPPGESAYDIIPGC